MSEEIVDVIDQEVIETTETDVEDVVDTTDEVDVDDTTDTQEETTEETEEQEQDTEFNPDEVNFDDDEDLYKFGDYNLSKYKDVLDISSDEVVEDFKNTAKELSEHGFTQEQIEFLIDRSMTGEPQEQSKEPTREEIERELKENLTVTERRDYKKVGAFLKEQLQNTDLEGYYKEAMSNAGVYKLVHTLYNKATNTGKPLDKVVNTNEETRTPNLTFNEALEEYSKYLGSHLTDTEGKEKEAKRILSRLSDKDKKQFKKSVLGL